MRGHEMAMDYLHANGLGGAPKPDLEIPDYEAYFLSKNLEILIDSGKDILTKHFEMEGEAGTKFKACFKLEKIIETERD